jgi:hypothetical protein
MFAGQFALTIAALFTEAAIYITSPSILGERLPGALRDAALDFPFANSGLITAPMSSTTM